MKKNSVKQGGDAKLEASFRDPAGFVFRDERGVFKRQVNDIGARDFELLHESGLYDALTRKGLLVSHKRQPAGDNDVHAIIEPEQIDFISYPFEWSFSQLKDAALLTLQVQKDALAHGMTLKDASAYNVQFKDGKPIFIDTLSFEAYVEGSAWAAYRQYCQHFLAPLALMARVDPNMSQLMRIHLDGIPLPLAAKLMPQKSRLNAGLMMHLFMHARAQKAKASEHKRQSPRLQLRQLQAIIDSLERCIRSLKPRGFQSEWGDYYANNTNYSVGAADAKARLVRSFASGIKVRTALDVGGNNGRYSRVLNDLGIFTVCSDIDPNAVEANYRYTRSEKETAMLPLLVDLTNPGGALGWQNKERSTIAARLQTDMVMALAVIHHLAISNNLPLEKIAECFAEFAPYLILEFVPKEDSQVQKLLSTREDIFPDYNEDGCKTAFGKFYRLDKEEKIKQSKRTLYLFVRK